VRSYIFSVHDSIRAINRSIIKNVFILQNTFFKFGLRNKTK